MQRLVFCGLAGSLIVFVATTQVGADESRASAVQATATDAEGFRPLFNGRDLTGWVNVNTAPSTWSVRDGMLICTGKPIGELRTDRMYQNFVLELEWRHMVPKGNAGVFVWADDITARGQPFIRGIEVQILDGREGNWFTSDGDIFPIHGARMTPINGRGGSRAFPTEKRANPSPQWNHYRITCHDGDISLAVNGKVVTRGKNCNPRKGYICLESEGGVVHYRNIRIKELPDTPIDPSMVAIADRGFKCLYTGVDLSGWRVSKAASDNWHDSDWTFFYDGQAPAGADRAIATAASFGDIDFILDFRFREASTPFALQLRGSEAAQVRFAPGGKHVARVKGWNRIEGTIKGGKLTVLLNGQAMVTDRDVSQASATGPLRIIPTAGPVDFANPYVRQAR